MVTHIVVQVYTVGEHFGPVSVPHVVLDARPLPRQLRRQSVCAQGDLGSCDCLQSAAAISRRHLWHISTSHQDVRRCCRSGKLDSVLSAEPCGCQGTHSGMMKVHGYILVVCWGWKMRLWLCMATQTNGLSQRTDVA